MRRIALLLLVFFVLSLPMFAAKQIIVLPGTVQSGTQITLKVAFWYAITSGALSGLNGSVWTGASVAENTAIQNGTVLEEVTTFTFPVNVTAITIKDTLSKAWTQRNAALSGQGPALYSGIYYDGTTGWSQ